MAMDDLFNLSGRIGVDDKPLDSGLARAEKKVEASAKRMDTIASAIKLGAIVQGFNALGQAGQAAFAAIRGDAQAVADAVSRLPFGIGQAAKSLADLYEIANGFDGEAMGKEFDSIVRPALQRRAAGKSSRAESQKTLDDIRFEMQTEGLDAVAVEREKFERDIGRRMDAARGRLSGADSTETRDKAGEELRTLQKYRQQKLEQFDVRGAAEFREEQRLKEKHRQELDGPEFEVARISAEKMNELLIDDGAAKAKEEMDKAADQSLRRDIEDQRMLNEANAAFFGEESVSGKGRQINPLLLAGGITGGAQNDPPKGKQVQRTNELLSEIIRKVGVQAAINVVAQ